MKDQVDQDQEWEKVGMINEQTRAQSGYTHVRISLQVRSKVRQRSESGSHVRDVVRDMGVSAQGGGYKPWVLG